MGFAYRRNADPILFVYAPQAGDPPMHPILYTLSGKINVSSHSPMLSLTSFHVPSTDGSRAFDPACVTSAVPALLASFVPPFIRPP